ncbi:hypothetical protein BOTBODRAFT_617717 [Botryobasidium botryosum FD-172 SS1]|uniref:Uncharacterized protein n=1 Tax=Botryobasidium botryosum (strain FD-172 SS1) TaxID=930990 RepID=A0A067M5I5_BOTB1|nr:hypothetical protein BOTBODRAFT_617717 [Botryobasidium botryosum FD-172 SS1]
MSCGGPRRAALQSCNRSAGHAYQETPEVGQGEEVVGRGLGLLRRGRRRWSRTGLGGGSCWRYDGRGRAHEHSGEGVEQIIKASGNTAGEHLKGAWGAWNDAMGSRDWDRCGRRSNRIFDVYRVLGADGRVESGGQVGFNSCQWQGERPDGRGVEFGSKLGSIECGLGESRVDGAGKAGSRSGRSGGGAGRSSAGRRVSRGGSSRKVAGGRRGGRRGGSSRRKSKSRGPSADIGLGLRAGCQRCAGVAHGSKRGTLALGLWPGQSRPVQPHRPARRIAQIAKRPRSSGERHQEAV